jgi:hypothetical protein
MCRRERLGWNHPSTVELITSVPRCVLRLLQPTSVQKEKKRKPNETKEDQMLICKKLNTADHFIHEVRCISTRSALADLE